MSIRTMEYNWQYMPNIKVAFKTATNGLNIHDESF